MKFADRSFSNFSTGDQLYNKVSKHQRLFREKKGDLSLLSEKLSLFHCHTCVLKRDLLKRNLLETPHANLDVKYLIQQFFILLKLKCIIYYAGLFQKKMRKTYKTKTNKQKPERLHTFHDFRQCLSNYIVNEQFNETPQNSSNKIP